MGLKRIIEVSDTQPYGLVYIVRGSSQCKHESVLTSVRDRTVAVYAAPVVPTLPAHNARSLRTESLLKYPTVRSLASTDWTGCCVTCCFGQRKAFCAALPQLRLHTPLPIQ